MSYKNNLKKLFFVAVLLIPSLSHAQEVINLYSGAIPNAKPGNFTEQKTLPTSGTYTKVVTPQLEIYRPENPNGTAVIICPGGSYRMIVFNSEGIRSAKEFVKSGVTAFVLKYRLPVDSIIVNKTIGPLQDAQQAIKVVRENAAKWGVDVNKVGVVGFSAGGHLASTVATHFQKPVIENSNNTNLRPDFVALVYPVISMQDNLTHKDSKRNLLGSNPSKEITDLYSNELQVDAKTPPAFLVHAEDDKVVDIDNSIVFYQSLKKNNVPSELHLFAKGGHGFGGQPIDMWMGPLIKWMQNNKWVNK